MSDTELKKLVKSACDGTVSVANLDYKTFYAMLCGLSRMYTERALNGTDKTGEGLMLSAIFNRVKNVFDANVK